MRGRLINNNIKLPVTVGEGGETLFFIPPPSPPPPPPLSLNLDLSIKTNISSERWRGETVISPHSVVIWPLCFVCWIVSVVSLPSLPPWGLSSSPQAAFRFLLKMPKQILCLVLFAVLCERGVAGDTRSLGRTCNYPRNRNVISRM